MKMIKVLAMAVLTVICGVSAQAQDSSVTSKLPVTKSLKLWLSADVGVSKDSSGKVSSWTSQIDPKIQFSQEYADLQPVCVADAVNGLPALRFDGKDDCMTSKELPKEFAGDLTVFVVWASTAEQAHLGQDGVNNRIISAPTVKGADWETGFQLTTGSKEITKPSVAVGTYKERPQLKYLGLAGMTQPDTGYTGGFNFTGDIAEILIYGSSLSDADTAAIKKYLQDKYKITSAANK